jgi:hypothetical protein
MKEMTNKEITMLGKDLKMAKMLVLHKYGFSCDEIARIVDAPESVVRNLVLAQKSNGEQMV